MLGPPLAGFVSDSTGSLGLSLIMAGWFLIIGSVVSFFVMLRLKCKTHFANNR